jgi:hypothetical protein
MFLLIVCVAGLPESAAGVVIDVVILTTVIYVAFHKTGSLAPTGR